MANKYGNNETVYGLELEKFLRRIYGTEDHWSDLLRGDPFPCIMNALRHFGVRHPQKTPHIDAFEQAYSRYAGRKIKELLNDGEDLDVLVSDLRYIVDLEEETK